MTDWGAFPSRQINTVTPLFRIHQYHLHPAWFSTDGLARFYPLPSDRDRFGVCYLGLDPLAAYVEVFGRIRAVPPFGEPGETPNRFGALKTSPIAGGLIAAGRQFHIEDLPAAPLP